MTLERFFNSRQWTPKAGNIARDKSKNRRSKAARQRHSLKRARQRQIDLQRAFERRMKRGV